MKNKNPEKTEAIKRANNISDNHVRTNNRDTSGG